MVRLKIDSESSHSESYRISNAVSTQAGIGEGGKKEEGLNVTIYGTRCSLYRVEDLTSSVLLKFSADAII